MTMEPVRFLHIPKTGGSTFTDILQRQYGGYGCFAFTGDLSSDVKRFKALPENERAKIALFMGHAPIVTGIDRADHALTITLLRNPISRVKSFCQHVAEGKSPHLVHNFPPETFCLDEFLESGNGELSNLQTKMLVTHGCGASTFDNMSASEAKDAACSNLTQKIAHFGLQEYFDESIMVISAALHWKMPLYTSKNKKNAKKLIRFEEHHLQRIAELNTLDLELYALARKTFMSLLKQVEFNSARLKWFQLLNAFKSREQFIGLAQSCLRRLSRTAP